ncbi:DUF6286 domain-containing protein [Phytoactinopolyspora limicola]|uniref:DUF6286 domain-containing protein n=1 Tax=Phytoactinopolyspora limicola TaxID=2715536 RepID=UPI0014082BA5|nr:DUF6286 domain-containing protein [Phytoactinopolyspora limicola]
MSREVDEHEPELGAEPMASPAAASAGQSGAEPMGQSGAEPMGESLGVPDPSDRGRLRIDERAVRRIAEQAAAEVTGRTRSKQGLAGLGARSLPQAQVKVIGRHVRIEIEVATPDGGSLPDWARRVRDVVRRRVGELAGLTVDIAHVHLAAVGTPSVADNTPVLPAADRPARPGPARAAGVLLALVAVALGVVAGLDALVASGVIEGDGPIGAVLERVDGLRPADWMVVAGALAMVVGLGLVLAALWRRPRRSLPLTSDTGVYVSRGAVEGLVADTARQHPGVIKVRAVARGTSVVVRLDTDGEAAAESEVRDAVHERLDRLDGPYDVRTSVRRSGVQP